MTFPHTLLGQKSNWTAILSRFPQFYHLSGISTIALYPPFLLFSGTTTSLVLWTYLLSLSRTSALQHFPLSPAFINISSPLNHTVLYTDLLRYHLTLRSSTVFLSSTTPHQLLSLHFSSIEQNFLKDVLKVAFSFPILIVFPQCSYQASSPTSPLRLHLT